MKTARVIITGFVQGVGFRHFVRSEARKLGLTGWVRNLPAEDFGERGFVEALFQGDPEKIKEMIELCKKGPFLAEVKDVDVRYEDSKDEFKTFDIVQ